MIILRSESKRTPILAKYLLCLSRNKYVAVAENYMHPKDKKQIKNFLVLKS